MPLCETDNYLGEIGQVCREIVVSSKQGVSTQLQLTTSMCRFDPNVDQIFHFSRKDRNLNFCQLSFRFYLLAT